MKPAQLPETPFVSLTDLLTGALLIFVLMIMVLALNQNEIDAPPSELETDIELLESERLHLSKLVVDLDRQTRTLETNRDDLIVQIDLLQRRHTELSKEIAKISNYHTEAEADVDELDARRIELSLAISSLEERQQIKTTELVVLDDEIGKRTEGVKELEVKIPELKQSIVTLTSDIDNLETERSDLENSISRLKRDEERRSGSVAQDRSFIETMLSDIGKFFGNRNLPVTIDPSSNSFSLPEEILFDTGKTEITLPEQKQAIISLAQLLMQVLPCLTPSRDVNCDPNAPRISTVLITGYADSQGDDIPNWFISARRAAHVYIELTKAEDALKELSGFSANGSQALFGISAFGETRPIVRTQDGVNEPRNRRIEVKFLFYDEDLNHYDG